MAPRKNATVIRIDKHLRLAAGSAPAKMPAGDAPFPAARTKLMIESSPRYVWPATITDLGDLRLRHPLIVTLEDHGDEFIASWHEVEAWAAGKTEAQAIDLLKDEVVALFREIGSMPDDQLGKLPKRWKRALRAIIADEP